MSQFMVIEQLDASALQEQLEVLSANGWTIIAIMPRAGADQYTLVVGK